MTDLDDRARRTLEIARAAHEPTLADRTRVRAALGARLHAEPLLLDAPGTPAAGSLGPVLDKLLLALGVGGVAGFAAGFFVAGLVAPAGPLAPPSPAPPLHAASAAPAPSMTDEPNTAETTPGVDAAVDVARAVDRAPSAPTVSPVSARKLAA